MVELLEQGLANLSEVWIREGMLGDVARPGDGAAGGLGAGLRAFCNAEVSSGADLVAQVTGFDEAIRDAHLLVTGEGRTDEQTASGKLCAVLAAKAKDAGAKTVLISGVLQGDLSDLEDLFDAVFATVSDATPHEKAIENGRQNLARKARFVGRELAMGVSLSEAE